ncbi:MAG: hypothetical protein GVY06_01695 [Alphaproteobacteria bacterium]|jgi:O-antigen ligase|nr:hypothetical protein [Alphaproteobacteria bacterium]
MVDAGISAHPREPVWPRIELGLVLICLVLFSGGLVQRLIAGEQDADGNIILRLMWLPVYAGVAGLAFTRFQHMARLALRMPVLMALVMLALVSFFWSIDPALSLRRGVAAAATTAFALYLVVRYDGIALLQIIGGVWFALAFVNFAAGLVAPGFAHMHEIHAGAWRGFWFEKNSLGGQMARAAMVLAVLILVDVPRRRLWTGGLVLAGLLVILSTSATALLALLIALGVTAAGAWMQRGPAHAVIVAWIGASLAGALLLILLTAPGLVLGLLGKDPTLTGRTEIWSALQGNIAERPWLGYGYDAFWAPDSVPAHWVRVAVKWEAPSAHHGWLDLCLSLGVVGLVGFTLQFALTAWRAAGNFLSHPFAIFAVGYLAQFLLFTSSESLILASNHMAWIFYVIVAASLAKGLGDGGRGEPRRAPAASGLRIERSDSFTWRGPG